MNKIYSFVDIKLSGLAGLAWGVVLAKILTTDMLASIPYWVLIVLAVIFSIKPAWIFLRNRNKKIKIKDLN